MGAVSRSERAAPECHLWVGSEVGSSVRLMESLAGRVRARWPRPFLPLHLFVCFAATGVLAGVVLGAVLGSRYLPTLPFALVEGGILVGVPIALLGALIAGSWGLTRRLRGIHR